MINKLHIKNFQSHKDSVLEFDPGVNIIVGKTDSGKSAIIRSLKLVAFNRPTGDSYTPLYWKGDTAVTVETEDGHTITRMKGSSKNLYVVDDLKLKAFGTSVPEEVQKALNMDNINFQFQIDLPFLISQTSGEVGQYINRIANLEIIDKGTKNVKRWTEALKKDLEFEKQSLAQNEQRLQQFENLDEYEQAVIGLENLLTKVKNIQTQYEELEILVDKYRAISHQKKQIKKRLSVANLVDKTLAQYKELKQLKQQKDSLVLTIKRYKSNKRALAQIKTSLKIEDSVDTALQALKELQALKKQQKQLHQLITDVKDVTTTIKSYKKKLAIEKQIDTLLQKIEQDEQLVVKHDRLESLLKNIKQLQKSIVANKKKFKELEKTYHDNYPDICPFCGNKTR